MTKTALLTVFTLVFCVAFAVGGDTFDTAVSISALPFFDTGDTSGLTNAIGYPSPDAFYFICTPSLYEDVCIDLSGSEFDTYLRIYDSAMNLIAFNDDGGIPMTTSMISGLTIEPNITYYICVEGYSTSSGMYQIDITGFSGHLGGPHMFITSITPPHRAVNVSLSPTLSWHYGFDVAQYDLYLDTANPPQTMVISNAVADHTTGGNYTPPFTLLEGINYYWRAVTRNQDSSLEIPDRIYSFTTAFSNDIVTIGSGTSRDIPLPIEPRVNHSYSQSIYLQQEINMPNQLIESIRFYFAGAPLHSLNSQWTIYIGHTNIMSFTSNSNWVSQSDLTYCGDYTFDETYLENSWLELQLETPFYYINSDNLVIAIDESHDLENNSASDFFCTQTQSARSLNYHSSSVNPIPGSLPTGTRVYGIPNIALEFGAVSTIPSDINIEYNAESVQLNWENPAENYPINISGYRIYCSESPTFEMTPENLIGISQTNSFLHLTDRRCMFYKVSAVTE